MCNSGTCPHEQFGGPNWGDCRKKSWQKCPDEMTEEEMIEAEEREDLRGDYLYEQQRERSWGL
jgi:hypothetical protein